MKVIELAQIMAGPTCGMLLADMGADVIKVEPRRGDWIRNVGRKAEHSMSPTYVSMNRNNRGLCIEMKDPRGLAAVQALATKADIVVESFRPGVI